MHNKTIRFLLRTVIFLMIDNNRKLIYTDCTIIYKEETLNVRKLTTQNRKMIADVYFLLLPFKHDY